MSEARAPLRRQATADADDLEPFVECFYDEDLFPGRMTLYANTDSEGEPQEKTAAELWPSVARRRPNRISRLGSKESVASQSTCAQSFRMGSHSLSLATPDCSTALGSQEGVASQSASQENAAAQPAQLTYHESAESVASQSACREHAAAQLAQLACHESAECVLAQTAGQGSAAEQRAQSSGQEVACSRPPTATPIPSASAASRDAGQAEVTTLVVRNLPEHATQQEFLEEVDNSGFLGAYDFAYLPRIVDRGCCAGHAFVNFKTPEFAATFKAAWHWSVRFIAGLGSAVLNVAPAALQGFHENADRWTNPRMARVMNADFLPYISREHTRVVSVDLQAEARSERRDWERGVTTLVVQNLSEFTTQQEFLDQVNRSGFAGMYDFAYLPLCRDSGRCSGHAFLNFRTPAQAAAFQALWHRSTNFSSVPGTVALNVAASVRQGFHANSSKWTDARLASVKNSLFLPFIFRPSRPAVDTTASARR